MRSSAFVLLAAALAAPAAEPEFLGRKLAAWAEQLRSDPVPRKRRAAAVALGQLALEGREARVAALPALGRAIRSDGQAAVREQAVGAVAALPADDALPLVDDLAESLRSESEAKVRRQVAQILGRFGAGARPALLPLTKSLADADDGVRAAAAEALGRVGPPAGRAAAELIARLDDPAPAVAQAAAFALGRVAPPDPDAAAEALRKRLDAGGEPPLRREAVESLRLLNRADGATVATLARLLGDSDATLRQQVATTLGAFGAAARPADAPLTQRLRDEPNKEVRAQVVRAVGQLWADAPDTLRERLAPVLASDTEFEVRVIAAEEFGALGAAGKGALPILQAARRDPQLKVREAAAEAIHRIEAPPPRETGAK